jgi:hypothetical protein
LTAVQAHALNMRVDAGDTHVKRIFVKYETDKDVYHLIDSLKALNLGEEPEEANEEVSLLICLLHFTAHWVCCIL